MSFFAGGFGPAEAVPFLQNAAQQEQHNGWDAERHKRRKGCDLGGGMAGVDAARVEELTPN